MTNPTRELLTREAPSGGIELLWHDGGYALAYVEGGRAYLAMLDAEGQLEALAPISLEGQEIRSVDLALEGDSLAVAWARDGALSVGVARVCL